MNMTFRCRQTTFSVTMLLLTVPLSAPRAAAAGPYEIRAKWTEDTRRLRPAAVDFAFDAIEYVPHLGVMVFGDHLLLRILHDEPFVTLGIQALHDTATPTGYGSAAPLPDGGRLLTRTTVRTENGARARETTVVRLDDDGRNETPFAFPSPSHGAAWTSVRLFTDADGRVFAYAGCAQPKTVPIDAAEVSSALEQRFFRLAANQWQELPPLDPAIVSATDACFVDRALVVVGSRIEKNDGDKVTARRGIAAELFEGGWSVSEMPAPGDAEAFSMAGVRCGRSRDRVYALAVAAAPGQAIGRATLTGAPALYRLDGERWQLLALPESQRGDAASRVTAFTVDRTGALWLSYAATGPEEAKSGTLHRYKDASWTAAVLPSVPEVDFYALTGIAFDDDGTGWAIANRKGNATTPESHGILLTYDSNVRNEWRLRGWNWNPFRQRWFGLLGNLR